MAHRWWTLTAVAAGMFMLLMDVTIVKAVATTARTGFTGNLNTILLIGAAIAATAAITSLTEIRGRDFAAQPAAPDSDTGTDAARDVMTPAPAITRSPDDHR